MKRAHFLTPHMRINSKCIKDLNARPKTIKIIEKNRQQNLGHCFSQFYQIYLPGKGNKQTTVTKTNGTTSN